MRAEAFRKGCSYDRFQNALDVGITIPFACAYFAPGVSIVNISSYRDRMSQPQGYFVDESACEEFDKQFPPKEKQELPGQLF